MGWLGIEGHDDIVTQFCRGLMAGRLASTFLFVGPEGIGKRGFAVNLARSLLCEASGREPLEPCGHCPACAQVSAGTHPDLELIAKPESKNFIPVELLIGDKQHRMREGLCARIAMKPARGGYKIAIIDDADHFNQEGANCLLKTLEEPPPKSLMILIGTSPQRQLPTIRSRCQIIRFHPLPHDVCARLIQEQELATDQEECRRLAELSGGSLARAAELSDADLWDFRGAFYAVLGTPAWDSFRLASEVTAFAEALGKQDARVWRQRLRLVIDLAADFYRQLMRALCGSPTAHDVVLGAALDALLPTWPHDADAAAACLERCLIARTHVDANANRSVIIEAWIDDLALITRTGSSLPTPLSAWS